MDKELCFECKKRLLDGGYTTLAAILHCHHEPKEGPKCWCEYTNYDEGLDTFILIKKIGNQIEDAFCALNFCPQCGRKRGCRIGQ